MLPLVTVGIVVRRVGRSRYAEQFIQVLTRFILHLHSVNSDEVILQHLVRNISMKTADTRALFDQRYQTHLKHLKLKGLQPKTIDAYARGIRRMGEYFDHRIDELSPEQLTDYFSDLISSHSWSAVKLDLYGFKFYTLHVLGKPWAMPHFIKPPKVARLPDIVTVDEAQALFSATRTLSYKVFYFTVYSMGLRLSEGLALKIGDIDATRQRVHVRDSKGKCAPITAATELN